MENDKPKHAGGRPIAFDYDSVEWYTAITRLAMQGCTNTEIAYGLEDELHLHLSPSTFSEMLAGSYQRWNEEQNRERSKKLVYVLEHARYKLNAIVKGRFLKSALGGDKIISKSTTRRRMQIDGHFTDDEIIQTTESESVTQPDRAALATWLYHHDKDWRAIQRGGEPDAEADIPEANNGVDISHWITLENALKEGERALEQGLEPEE